jgi:Zn-dependent protease with chaperone function
MAQLASRFDGESAIEQFVTVEAHGNQLLLRGGDGFIETVPVSRLVRLYSVTDAVKLGHADRNGWRLILPKHVDADVAAILPAKVRTLRPPINIRAAGLGAAASLLVIALIGSLFLAPQLLAGQMPLPLERKLGRAVKIPQHIGRCENPIALEVLNKLIDELDPKARADGFTVEVLNLDSVNAAALPGGRIVILNGLFNNWSSEAVSGVLAHEIAHVRRRHVASAAVRQMGTASVIAVFGGSNVSAGATGLLALKFSRDAEAEADQDAVAMLKRAQIDPRPTAEMLKWTQEIETSESSWFSSHPATAERAGLFATSYNRNASYRRISEQEEDALANACAWQNVRFGMQE